MLARNSQTGRTGVQTSDLRIAADRDAPALLPPFFLDHPGWVMVRERAAEQAGAGSVVYPFTLKGEPYVPAAHPALAASDKAHLCLVAYNLGGDDLAVEGRVLDAAGRPLPGGKLVVLERPPSVKPEEAKMLATFEPTGLAAGSYVLQVAVKNPKTGRSDVNSMSFDVTR